MPGPSKREKRLQKRALEVPVVPKKPERPRRPLSQSPLIRGLRSALVTTSGWLSSLIQALYAVIRLPVMSYAAIVLLQLKVVWGMWWYKDLTSGDTTQYFLEGVRWYETGHNSVLWSPMYTAFYGSLLHWSSDPYAVTILHRLIIVFASAVLGLALMRRVLPPGIAWMAAAWWVILPINFNALYEVHLFTVVPLMLAVLAGLWWPGLPGRGLCAGILLLTGALMRNEYLVAAALFIALSLAWELFRGSLRTFDFKRIGLAFGLPILIACVLSVVFFIRSDPPYNASSLRGKQTLNVCQVYAAGYQQRASDFQGSPWTECDQLMNRFFGSADLTFLEAFRRNPSAMLGHVLWNLRLTPSGLEVLLFNYRYGQANPDYAPTYQSNLVLIPTLLACLIVVAGLILLVRERDHWRAEWTEQRIWGWIAMGCTAAAVFAALLSNRPRPSYMFILGITLRALVALCFYVIVSRWPNLRKVGAGVSVVLVAVVLYNPSIYQSDPSPRPILKALRRLKPAASAYAEPHPLLVSTEFGTELPTYGGHCNCPAIRFDQLRNEIVPGVSLAEVLDRKGANLFYADELILSDPNAQEFLRNASTYHWRVVDGRHTGGENWAVLRRNR